MRGASMCSACSTRHQAPGTLRRFSRDVTVCAFDFAGADRKSFGQRLAIFQLVCTNTDIAMECPHWRLVVARPGRLAVGDEGL